MDSFPQRKGWRRVTHSLPLWIVSLPAILFLALPMLAIVLRVPLDQLLASVVDRNVTRAIALSLTTTLITVGITVIFGTPLAYLLARRRFPARVALETLIDLAMVLPPAVAGIALLVAFGRRGLVGASLANVGVNLIFTSAAVVLAQTFVAAPFYVRTATSALREIRHEIEEAAAIDGASEIQTFARITVPLVLPSLFAGAVMTWARALGEFGATIIFAGNLPGRTQTIPLLIYLDFELDLQTSLVLAAILLAIAFAILLIVKLGLRRQVAEPW